jgi:hypothetical protein
MTREQRDTATRRLDVLNTRIFNLKDVSGTWMQQEAITSVIDESRKEIESIKKVLATRQEFLFNFKGGGWNSEMAFTREEAIEQAIEKYGQPSVDGRICNIDITTFRVSTASDKASLLSLFY